MLPERLAFVDIETTGTSLQRDSIIEIGILFVENNKLKATFQSLVNPNDYVPDSIEHLTGIHKEDLKNAPEFPHVIESILDLIPSDCVFVAHNVRFDYGFLRNTFKRYEIQFTRRHLCTVKLSRLLYPRFRKHNLDSIISRCNLKCDRRHRAFNDAKAIWEFYSYVQKKFSREKIEEVIKTLLRRPSLPIHLHSESITSLPQECGVYIFYGEDGMPLYVGKSKNIKDRVLSHFAGDHSYNTDMKIAQQIRSIETRVTPGELGALILESKLVKQLQPLYNHKLRIKKRLILLRNTMTKDGYATVVFETVEKIIYQERDSIIGMFKSKKQATTFLLSICEQYSLCHKVLGIEKTKKACFSYRLAKCKGACIGKENPLSYNIRFQEAVYKNKIKRWPFKGPIAIEEGNTIKEAFILDNWCLLGSVTFDANDSSFTSYDQAFDMDIYVIVTRYLESYKSQRNVRQLSNSKLQMYMQNNAS